MTTTSKCPRWTRTDQSDDATETLALVVADSGKPYYCAELGRETPYLVQVTTGDDRVGLYDLDGDRIDSAQVGSWELATGEIPADVIEQIESGWETGTSVVQRIAE